MSVADASIAPLLVMDLPRRVLNRHLTAKGTPEERLLRARLERISGRVQRLLDDARVTPQMPVSGISDALAEILQEADYGE